MLTRTRFNKRAKTQNRRDRHSNKGEAISDLKGEEMFTIWEFYTDKEGNTHCAYCDNEIYYNLADDRHRDSTEHIECLDKGGHSTAPNIIPACAHCNEKKGNEDLIEWFSRQEFFEESKFEKIVDSTRLINSSSCIYKTDEYNTVVFMEGEFHRLIEIGDEDEEKKLQEDGLDR